LNITITTTTTTTTMSPPPTPVFLITAASSGFGEAIAHEALSRGHHVIATARNKAKLDALQAAGAAVLDLDVTSDEATLAAIFQEASAIHGRITHVVNCAGYLLEGAVEEGRWVSLLGCFCFFYITGGYCRALRH
jgi:NAD(P)-dependent dehydrogenase (short-subunit alcohol dehydrogenase family)